MNDLFYLKDFNKSYIKVVIIKQKTLPELIGNEQSVLYIK